MCSVRRRFWLWIGLLGACTGGQSGTELPDPVDVGEPDGMVADDPFTTMAVPSACVCDLAHRAALVRAQVTKINPCMVQARVTEVLAPAREGTVETGDDVNATLVNHGGCGSGVEAGPGDDVLIVYAPRRQMPDGNELEEARALVSRWQDRLVFGRQAGELITVDRAEVDGLVNDARCIDLFPAPQAGVEPDPGPTCPEP